MGLRREEIKMAEIELLNETDLQFVDISSETTRTYWFPGNESITIPAPQFLNVSRSGGHRLLTANGVSFYVPKGWIALSWEAKDGAPHFVK
jgi:hypothetical protein